MLPIDVGARHDAALLAAPDGTTTDYVKQHLILGVETPRFIAGPAAFGILPSDVLTPAALICYDLDFPAGPRVGRRAGAEVLAAPAMDWPTVMERHALQVAMRAAESGLPLVRAPRHGVSVLVDPTGQVVKSATDETSDVVLVGDLSYHAPMPPYARLGDVVTWASIAFLASAAWATWRTASR